ncbi:MAG: hypothetical protein JWM93_3910 [Frankiales bacterium]|nr:hypothetical protein [Frankiales bacterium]
MPRGTRITAALLLAVTGVNVASCTSSAPSLGTLPPVTTSTTAASTLATSPTPSATASAAVGVPTAAPHGDNSDSAAATSAEHFVWASWMAGITQDIALMTDVASPSCACLDRARSAIKAQQDLHHRAVSDPMPEIESQVIDNATGTSHVRVRFTLPAYRIVNDDGSVARSQPASTIDEVLTLQYAGSVWKVTKIEASS